MKIELLLPRIEEKVLEFWKENKIFEKSLEQTKKGPRFIFYEGPPFANGLPGIHHLLARALKDVILRYKTMQGFYVERKAGWDTHGLPTEMATEKKLGIKTKKEIEGLGIEKFIEECRNNVFTYKKEWEEFTERIAFWLDFKNAYITCSNEYIESLWWILKQIWEKKLLYQDYKIVPYCPRCGTSLSSHEVAQGYKEIKEPAIYVKFKIKSEPDAYFLAWTTTPWTLPGNLAIAVNPKLLYAKVKVGKDYLILAKDRLSILNQKYQIIEELKGEKLINLEYEPLFRFGKLDKKAYFVISADFVSAKEGTGLVHMAPAFGEEDMEVGKQNDLPVLMTINEEGKFKADVKPWAGIFVKEADPLIIKDLQKRNLLYKEEDYEHEYPFCWRCDSVLLYYAKTSWFIKMTAIKEDLLKNNQKINWVPGYLKEGRFGEWLREIKDWNLSRERYWGTPLPIWQCEKCKKQICIGSIKELAEKSKAKIDDLHRPYIDKITFRCECGERMKRVPEVIDCWFDSGSMPFAQWHYPFENKERIDKGVSFPADYICEGIDQTRGWFYTLLAVSTLLNLGAPYKNIIVNGIVLDAKGQKMSKSKGNVVWPKDIINHYGADAARFYFYTVNSVAEPKRFNSQDVQSLYRKFFDTLLNTQTFFSVYTDKEFKPLEEFRSSNLLDCWIVSRLQSLISNVNQRLDEYNVIGAARLFEDFVGDLSNWYIRRSRRRFQRPKAKKEKIEASQTLNYVLAELAKALAPFCPFISEKIYQQLKDKRKESVHLTAYPKPRKDLINLGLEEQMVKVRKIAALALAERAAVKIKVRQPLLKIEVRGERLEKELVDLIREEVNVKEVIWNKDLKKEVKLDTEITKDLRKEGIIRETLRQSKKIRKKMNLKPEDKVEEFIYETSSDLINETLKEKEDYIKREVGAEKIRIGESIRDDFDYDEEVKIDISESNVKIRVKK